MDDDKYKDFCPSVPMTWQGVSAVVLSGVAGIIDEIGGIFEGLATVLAADHNWRIDQRNMREQAALEIEMLTRGFE